LHPTFDHSPHQPAPLRSGVNAPCAQRRVNAGLCAEKKRNCKMKNIIMLFLLNFIFIGQQPINIIQHSVVENEDLVNKGYLNGLQNEAKPSWLKFIKSGKYRIANKNDFNIPKWVINSLGGSDIEKAISSAFIGGDINHDGKFNDFAVIVINKRIGSPDKFSLVIFNEPEEANQLYSVNWLFKDKDLSRTVMSWWSGGLSITKYEENGESHYWYVNWDKINKIYRCERKYKK
jgi:hypothetical protein